MPIAIWNSRYETGIDAIDAQHKGLFEAFNQLADAFTAGTAPAHVKHCLKDLLDFTVDHFRTEESFMEALGYPDLAAHRAEHAQLVEKARTLQARGSMDQPAVAMDLTIFLANLMTGHIDEADLTMIRFLREKQQI